MTTPLEFVQKYRALRVRVPVQACSLTGLQAADTYAVQLRTYFMMNWTPGSARLADYRETTGRAGGPDALEQNRWFQEHRERIRSAAMGKGAPRDYELALEWAARSGDVRNPGSQTLQAQMLQAWCDQHLGIDCSGFATNYLCAAGRRSYSADVVRNTGAQSYYDPANAVNDATQVRQGDLLVWMDGNRPKSNPGHVAVVQSYLPASTAAGNMEVCEATGASAANPKLLCSRYAVTRIIDRGDPSLHNQVMVLECTRHGRPGSRVCVIRP
ncbi:MAG: hypothetical protein AB7O97_17235 [Planctomycetota bacterium]